MFDNLSWKVTIAYGHVLHLKCRHVYSAIFEWLYNARPGDPGWS